MSDYVRPSEQEMRDFLDGTTNLAWGLCYEWVNWAASYNGSDSTYYAGHPLTLPPVLELYTACTNYLKEIENEF